MRSQMLRRFAVFLASTLPATACTDMISPQRGIPGPLLSYSSTTDTIRIAGAGSIGPGPAQPGSDLRDFDFDVPSTRSGRIFFRDWAAVRPDGSVGKLTVAPADTATRISDFQNGSTACPDPARGVEIQGLGRVNSAGDSNPGGDELLAFTLVACDGSGDGNTVDWVGMAVPGHDYARGPDPISTGDVAKSSAGTPPPNQAPVVNAGPDSTLIVGVFYTQRTTFGDPDNGPWRYRIDWNDGTWDLGTTSDPGAAISATHHYLMPGPYRIRVTVLDNLGGADSDDVVITVVL